MSKGLSRRDVSEFLNISYKSVIRMEKEMSLFEDPKGSHIRFDNEALGKIKKYVDDNYRLPSNAIQIESSNAYVTPCGKIYKTNGNTNLFYEVSYDINHGYKYCRIEGKNKRVHRLVAEAFIPNEPSDPIVLHLDNNKTNNHIDNLKWGTVAENTRQAYDDGLAKNDKGYDDSQSIPIHMFNMEGDVIQSFGSITIASKYLNIGKSTIARQVKNESKPRNNRFYFRAQ